MRPLSMRKPKALWARFIQPGLKLSSSVAVAVFAALGVKEVLVGEYLREQVLLQVKEEESEEIEEWLDTDLAIYATVFPSIKPVRWKYTTLDAYWGFTEEEDDEWVISIHYRSTLGEARNTMMHEYAHVMERDNNLGCGKHCPTWGIAYSLLYTARLRAQGLDE